MLKITICEKRGEPLKQKWLSSSVYGHYIEQHEYKSLQ